MIKIIEKEDVFQFIDRTIIYPLDAINTVKEIIAEVRINKDKAVSMYTEKFDKVALTTFKVTQEEIENVVSNIDKQLLDDLRLAKTNISLFHEKQKQTGYKMDILTNSYVGQLQRPIASVGIYVPGGTASYPSTVLMNAIPAKIAGVKEIIMITPPNKEGNVADIILAAASIAEVDKIYKVGGAQGIAALAYGTETIPKVSKIMGPGNMYVALAKKEVFGQVGIDMIAGPSEITILADGTANARFIAADLISQAEHDEMASAILVTSSQDIANQVQAEVIKQVAILKRKDIITKSFKNYGGIILVKDLEEGIEIINTIAPEHLELMIENPESILTDIKNAGAIFLGSYSPEALGDYIAGPNHTLPTNGTSRFSSPLSVDDFMKKTSVISFTKEDLKEYKDSIYRLATKEQLDGHANAAKIRFKNEG